MDLFGFEIKKKEKESIEPSFTPKDDADGSAVLIPGGFTGEYFDIEGTIRNDAQLIGRYREMSMQPEVDAAIDEIVNESMSIDEDFIVQLNLDKVDIPQNTKFIIQNEHNNILNLLDFNRNAYNIYRKWYIDGRLYFHVMIDKNNPKDGIKELRYIDPRKIRKIREVIQDKKNSGSQASNYLTKTMNEFYLFSDNGFNNNNNKSNNSSTLLKVSKDSVVYVVSGLTDVNQNTVLSYLHNGMRALSQLKMLEDAMVIYRIARAPERRVWYIDTGNLPPAKAEQYVNEIMKKHKNRLVYDPATGSIRDDRKFQTMLEDYWLPRREGGKGTQVDTLQGGQTLGQMDDVLYFQKKFLQTLHVPVSRLNSDALFSIGRATEITRDEIKFFRFLIRLRAKFSNLFIELLEKQLLLKGIVNADEWKLISKNMLFTYSKDNYFTELKDSEIILSRIELARSFNDVVGKYYSHMWIRKNILKQRDEDIITMDKQISDENRTGDPRFLNPNIEQNYEMQQQIIQQKNNNDFAPGDFERTEDRDMGDGSYTEEKPKNSNNININKDNDKKNDDNTIDKKAALNKAKVTLALLRTKKGNRTEQEDEKYHSAIQIVARNKDRDKLSPIPLKHTRK